MNIRSVLKWFNDAPRPAHVGPRQPTKRTERQASATNAYFGEHSQDEPK